MSRQSTSKLIQKNCSICGKDFEVKYPQRGQKTCSRSCGMKHAATVRAQTYGKTLVPGTIGAMHEMVVAVDLMRRGFHVYRALSPACPCDLVVYSPAGVGYRVEVRTHVRMASGATSPSYMNKKRDPGRQDCFALVTHDQEITYIPDITQEVVGEEMPL